MPTVMPASGVTLRQLAERGERVFSPFPQAARYFPAGAVEDARQRLGRSIERGEGPGLVIGAAGTGKSLLLQVLAASYHSRFDVVLLACARLCTRRALLQAILFELGLPYKQRDEGELRLSLLDHLLSEAPSPAPAQSGEGGLLLLVDEAHTLPLPLLDELRVLTNLVRGGAPRVRLVLAGAPALEETFASAELESFSQRLAARCYLSPLRRDETAQFIRAQVRAAGAAPDEIFAGEAFEAAFEATDGVPRLLNQLCDRALCFAAAAGEQRIARDIVQQAWSDLQQLPMPWETPPVAPPSQASTAIEFGELVSAISDSRDLPEDSSNLEPTEIDAEEEDALSALGSTNEPAESCPSPATDPFAEAFEDEEVVLDHFAAWENIFGRAAPRVENRRDPGFASLVEAAIAAAPQEPLTAASDCVSLAAFTASATGEAEPEPAPEELQQPLEQTTREHLSSVPRSIRPQLRLAEIPEAVLHRPMPPLIESTLAESWDDDLTFDLPTNHGQPTEEELEESAVLVVEEDATSEPKPPVRREEYRDLFSRLRSG